jgi:hypothetical protein
MEIIYKAKSLQELRNKLCEQCNKG